MSDTFFARSGASPPETQRVGRTARRATLIRKATPNGDTLENLFEMSNRICDLCGHPIQDLICAALEHSTPVIYFAKSTMPIEEAIAQANDPKNIRVAHSSCNSAKNVLTREEWFARGLNDREAPRLLTEGQLLELQFRLGAGGRATAASGKLAFALTPADRLRGARVSGKRAFERGTGIFAPGYLQKGIGGRKMVAKKIGMFAPENLGMGGRIAGPKTNEMHIGIFAPDFDKRAPGRIGGPIGGRKAKELGLGIFAPGMAAAGGRIASRINNHERWHIKRGIVNPNCELCRASSGVAA
jgi:hypothetical protein